MALRDSEGLACGLYSCTARYVDLISGCSSRASSTSAAIACLKTQLLRSLRGHGAVVMRMELNALSLDRLPVPVLRHVFAYLSLTDVITLSCTSSVLRTTIVDTAGLWSRIRAYPLFPVDYSLQYPRPPIATYDSPPPGFWKGVLELLQRSTPVPAHLALRVEVSRSYAALSNLLVAALQRSEVLTLNLCGLSWTTTIGVYIFPANRRTQYVPCIGTIDIAGWLRVSSLLTSPAPTLRAFSLIALDESLPGSIDFVRDLRLPSDFLGGDAPCLRRLSLHGIALPVNLPATLSQLVLFDYHPWPGYLTSGDVYTFLSHMPQLRTLGITFRLFSIDPGDISSMDSRWTALPALLDVFVSLPNKISSYMISDAVFLFKDRLNVPNIRMSVGGRWVRGVDSARRNANTMDGFPHHLHSPERITIADRFITISSRGLHVMRDTWYQLMLGHDTKFVDFSRLTSLTVDEMHWPETDGLAPAPSLTHLHIITARGNIFVSMLEAPWSCGLLQELMFSYVSMIAMRETSHMCDADCRPDCPHRSVVRPGSIALADVRSFISTNLQISSHRMARIALAGFGVVVDPEPGWELLRLYEIADEVTLSSALEGIDELKVPRRGGRSYASVGDFYTGVYDGESRDDILRQDISGTYT